jgi:hypothetical protein
MHLNVLRNAVPKRAATDDLLLRGGKFFQAKATLAAKFTNRALQNHVEMFASQRFRLRNPRPPSAGIFQYLVTHLMPENIQWHTAVDARNIHERLINGVDLYRRRKIG